MLGPTGPLQAATDRTSASLGGRSPWLGFAMRTGAAAIPLVATVALAIAALPLYRLHLRARTSAPTPAYAVHASAGGLVAANPARGLGISFGRSGASVRDGTLHASLALRAVGYGHSLEPVARAAPEVHSGRVTYSRPGVVEWYLNTPRGLEQGFTLARAPRRDTRRPLALEIALSGNAHASLSASRQSVTLVRAGGPALRYGELHASDATGRSLRSWLSLRREAVLLTVDARGARYPLSIDPLVQQGEKLTDGLPNAPIYFGASAALSSDGSTALIGAPRYNGNAWVFARSGATWQRGAMLGGPQEKEVGETGAPCVEEAGGEEGEADSGCGFGASVALSGDGNTAIVGSPRERRPCATGPACAFQGAAWVFFRNGTNWVTQAVLLGGAKEAAGARFGRAVALSADGNTALIGAPADQGSTGAVWVFTRSEGKWTQQGPKLIASGELGPGRFGYALALSADGNAALIGAPGDAGYVGATWSFTRSGTSWIQGQKLEVIGEVGPAHFGSSVALSSGAETALVGGFRDNGNRGAVWPFARSGTSWAPGQKLTGVGEKGGNWFGYSVALSGAGGFALVGGPSGAEKSSGVGMAWGFTRNAGSWGALPQIIRPPAETPPPETPSKPRFGHSVALSGDGKIALIGGPRDKDVEGAAWAFSHEREEEGPTEKELEETEREEEKERAVTPEITSVQPNQGPTAGGTTLTIRGHYLLETTQVEFGPGTKVKASPITTTERAITVVSPPHAPGSVDLVVKIRGGAISATSPGDVFTFLAPDGHQEERPAAGGGSTGATGGILAYGPKAGAASACAVSLLNRTITVSGKGRTPLKLRLSGTGACRGKLTLSVKTKRAHARPKVRTIASGGFSTTAGRTAVVTLALNKLGRALLRAAHGRLGASLAIVRLAPAPVQARTASVRLTLQRSHATPTKKH
jgi:hypothetical protein